MLLVSDNGRDDLGAFRPPDELNAFDVRDPVPDFGFPGCFGQGGSACAGTRPALAKLPAHASADGVAVTADWAGRGPTAFVAEYGSSFKANPTGRDVRIVDLAKDGLSGTQRRFASGFTTRDPLGAAIGPDGALYVTQLLSGKVLRFSEPG